MENDEVKSANIHEALAALSKCCNEINSIYPALWNALSSFGEMVSNEAHSSLGNKRRKEELAVRVYDILRKVDADVISVLEKGETLSKTSEIIQNLIREIQKAAKSVEGLDI